MSFNSCCTNNSFNQSVHITCDSTSRRLVTLAFNISRGILLLPLSTFILYLGFKQWRQPRSFKAASHFDIFTYHQVTMELIWGLGRVFNRLGVIFHIAHIECAGNLLSRIIFFGGTSIHILTCLERYLAVVYPVTYKALQNRHGAKMRNGSIVFAWLMTLMWAFVFTFYQNTMLVFLFLVFLSLSFVLILLFSFFVLRVLVHRGPGEGDRRKGQMNQMKQKALFTVTAILGVVFIWFSAYLVATAIAESGLFTGNASCMIYDYVMWLSIPSSLILPLIYLHKKELFSDR